jgi:hypothetical protein
MALVYALHPGRFEGRMFGWCIMTQHAHALRSVGGHWQSQNAKAFACADSINVTDKSAYDLRMLCVK